MAPGAPDRPAPVVSVVLCTFNRSHVLAEALGALHDQRPDTPPYEVVVVDNNSTDDTRGVVQRFLDRGIVRYVFEERQGLSVARNRGVAAARADILAFTDDDVRVDSAWVRTLARALEEQPDVEMVGGRVEPEWQGAPPSWLPDAGTAPLALVDYGSQSFRLTPRRPVCLIGANVAVRRRAFDRVGGFSTELQRLGNSIGSTEDQEFQTRLLSTGVGALYEPRMAARTLVPHERLSKAYYRAWHRGHGRFYALMRDPSFERSRLGTVLGVPAHVYRRVLGEGLAWLGSACRRRNAAAFTHELQVRFLAAFTIQRILGQRRRARGAPTASVSPGVSPTRRSIPRH